MPGSVCGPEDKRVYKLVLYNCPQETQKSKEGRQDIGSRTLKYNDCSNWGNIRGCELIFAGNIIIINIYNLNKNKLLS